jgi:hypothetical protein
MFDLSKRNAARLETIFDSTCRYFLWIINPGDLAVFDSVKAFLFHGGNQVSVVEQAR